MITASQGFKLALAAVLVLGVLIAALARAPRERSSRIELRRLMLCASVLYAVGLAASLTEHGTLAALVYATGIAICALALWLSRGSDPGDPPDGPDDPGDEQPPPDPGGAPAVDWETFERQLCDYAQRGRDRVAV